MFELRRLYATLDSNDTMIRADDLVPPCIKPLPPASFHNQIFL